MKAYTHFEWRPLELTWVGRLSLAERAFRVGSPQRRKQGKVGAFQKPLTWRWSRGRAPAQWSSAPGILPTGECARGCPAPRQVNHRRAWPPGARIPRSGADSGPELGCGIHSPRTPSLLTRPRYSCAFRDAPPRTLKSCPQSRLLSPCLCLPVLASPAPPQVSSPLRLPRNPGRGAGHGRRLEPARPVGRGAGHRSWEPAGGAGRGPRAAPCLAVGPAVRGAPPSPPVQRAPSWRAVVVAVLALRTFEEGAGSWLLPSGHHLRPCPAMSRPVSLGTGVGGSCG